jgi:hypothetical protein
MKSLQCICFAFVAVRSLSATMAFQPSLGGQGGVGTVLVGRHYSVERTPIGLQPTAADQDAEMSTKSDLLGLLASSPRNAPTPATLTRDILNVVRQLEEAESCPTADTDVLSELVGSWGLLWTTQDRVV